MLTIGHRGAAGHAPENTIASVRKAIELGADWVEIDLYCVDNQLMVFHDDRLERTTNGSGLVMEQRFEYLRSLDAGNGERIPTLQEIFETVQDSSRPLGINIELKGPKTAQAAVQFLQQWLVEHPDWPADQLLVSSFQHEQLRQVRSLNDPTNPGQTNPNIRLGVLFGELPEAAIAIAQSLGASTINPRLDTVTAAWVEAAHQASLQVWVYTVNEPEDWARMRSLRVDAVFTDYPDRR
ncbi:MAG: glycerophosphoryl diester phosphodiesterase [Synechococcales cyanobacterium CRU_2_2]|nr:glycerophosphoryl diester phosphodiesterase [Synechococcales cyanobacterium CRU_2_2]